MATLQLGRNGEAITLAATLVQQVIIDNLVLFPFSAASDTSRPADLKECFDLSENTVNLITYVDGGGGGGGGDIKDHWEAIF